MTQLTEEHFELHTKNKAEQHERQKIKFLEDRITTLEKSIERLNKIVSIWKLGQEENNHE
jgi:TolA-binding protein